MICQEMYEKLANMAILLWYWSTPSSVSETMRKNGWFAEELFHYIIQYKTKWQVSTMCDSLEQVAGYWRSVEKITGGIFVAILLVCSVQRFLNLLKGLFLHKKANNTARVNYRLADWQLWHWYMLRTAASTPRSSTRRSSSASDTYSVAESGGQFCF